MDDWVEGLEGWRKVIDCTSSSKRRAAPANANQLSGGVNGNGCSELGGNKLGAKRKWEKRGLGPMSWRC